MVTINRRLEFRSFAKETVEIFVSILCICLGSDVKSYYLFNKENKHQKEKILDSKLIHSLSTEEAVLV